MDGAAEQLSFLDEAPAVRPRRGAWRDRLYFAIHPDAGAIAEIAAVTGALAGHYGLTAKPRPAHTLHVSVLYCGPADEVSPEQVAIAAEAARTVAFWPFEIRLTHAVGWKHWSGGVIVLRCDDEGTARVNTLAEALAAKMVTGGFRPAGRAGGVAHLTLLYDRGPVPETELAAPIRLRVRGFSLTRNHWGEGRYDRERFALSG